MHLRATNSLPGGVYDYELDGIGRGTGAHHFSCEPVNGREGGGCRGVLADGRRLSVDVSTPRLNDAKRILHGAL